MSQVFLLLPDFLLIVLGWFLCRHTLLDRSVWDSVEKLVYHLLFPVLLFVAILRQPLQPGALMTLAGCGLTVVAVGIALSYALGRWPGVDPRTHASGAQTAFRFNSYVALALAERLAGTQGVAWVALLVALCVPLCNIAAVWPLARHGGHGSGHSAVGSHAGCRGLCAGLPLVCHPRRPGRIPPRAAPGRQARPGMERSR